MHVVVRDSSRAFVMESANCMKVAIVGPFPEYGSQISGGVERVIDTLLPELARRVELTLIVPGALRNTECLNEGVRTIYLKRGPGPGSIRYWTIDAYRVAKVVERLAPDLVHLQGIAGSGFFLRRPAVLTVHGIIDQDLIRASTGGSLEAAARQFAARILRSVEHSTQKRLGNAIIINPYVLEAMPSVRSLRRFEIPNPVDPQFLQFAEPIKAVRSRRIVSIGRIGARKNTLELISLCELVLKKDPLAELIVCGSPTDDLYFQRCRDLVLQQGIEKRVKFAGNLSVPMLKTILDDSSCLIMTSRQETAPVAIAEAHSRGVAVVAPDAFGIPHMITEGWNGFFLPSENRNLQAAAIMRALDFDWDRAGLADEAHSTYDPKVVADKTVSAYQDVLRSSRGPAKSI